MARNLWQAVTLAVLVLGVTAAGAAASPSKIAWSKCHGDFQCGSLQVPLDYDDPRGARISLALAKLPAADPSRRIGSLFLNPGGPGGSGVMFALGLAPYLFTEEVRQRFDIVGFDPRGIAGSTPFRCFGSDRQWGPYFTPFAFPTNADEEQQWAAADQFLVDSCEQRGGRIGDHMSTANVARDMDRLRAAVGDRKLTYAGYSYGSFLGAVYANMFPDRVRALVVDGVLDPVDWTTGDPGEQHLPFSTRLGSHTASEATLDEMLRLCDEAGPERCAFAGDAPARYDALVERLREEPVVVTFPDGGQAYFDDTFLIGATLGALYDPFSWWEFTGLLAMIEAEADGSAIGARAHQYLNTRGFIVSRRGFPRYYNALEGFPGVACADTDNPEGYASWSAAAALAGGHFGPLWTWITSICEPWRRADADRYEGDFDAVTANPVLIVGNDYDPATPYHGAQRLREEMPNSALLTVHGYGHTSLFLSACADALIGDYLLTPDADADGQECTQDFRPFPSAPPPGG